jgi:CelD/BcsL family acetyltransferase involved in cellulose biosynthesis
VKSREREQLHLRTLEESRTYSSVDPAAELVRLSHADDAWRHLVDSSPNALPFHQPAWLDVVRECYGHRPFVLGLCGDDGTLAAGLPVVEARSLSHRKQWVALPYTDRCPPLALEGTSLERFARGLDQARAKTGRPTLEVRSALSGPFQEATVGLLHTLALDPDPDRVFASLRRSHAERNVKRAWRDGVEVWRATDRADLADTYFRFHVQTHRRHGAPVQPRRFFELLWDKVIGPGHGLLLLAGQRGTPVAGAVFLLSRSTVVYKYGGSDPDYWQLRPNYALFWEAIRWSCEHGHATLDFGRTDFGNEGLRRFKLGWGTAETPLRYTLLADRPHDDWPGRMNPGVSSVLSWAPDVVSRGVGALLYRYAISAHTSSRED